MPWEVLSFEVLPIVSISRDRRLAQFAILEKKRHTLKNTVIAQPDKFIVFLGRTFSGHNHDYLMLKQEFPPELDWFADINVRVDLGSVVENGVMIR